MNFKVGKCYEFCFSENRNAIFLERRGDILYFVTTGSGSIAAVVKEETFMDNKHYNFYEGSQIDGAAIMMVDLNQIFDCRVYVRELI